MNRSKCTVYKKVTSRDRFRFMGDGKGVYAKIGNYFKEIGGRHLSKTYPLRRVEILYKV